MIAGHNRELLGTEDMSRHFDHAALVLKTARERLAKDGPGPDLFHLLCEAHRDLMAGAAGG